MKRESVPRHAEDNSVTIDWSIIDANGLNGRLLKKCKMQNKRKKYDFRQKRVL